MSEGKVWFRCKWRALTCKFKHCEDFKKCVFAIERNCNTYWLFLTPKTRISPENTKVKRAGHVPEALYLTGATKPTAGFG